MMSDLIKQLRDLEEMLINGESTRRVPIDLLVRQAADALETKDAETAALKTCLERVLVFLESAKTNQAKSEARTTLYALYGDT